jgi:hypothetical protein
MLKLGSFLMCVTCGTIAFSQLSPAYKKPKNSAGKGTMFLSVGLNNTGYSASDIQFAGIGYDFQLNQSRAESAPIWNNKGLTRLPQMNARIGYMVANHYSISIGYDRMNYLLKEGPQLLSGDISPGLDTATNWSGSYTNATVTTNKNSFNYENSAVNFFRIGVERTDNIYEIGHWLMFTSQIGAGAGALYTSNDFNFAGRSDTETSSLSGFAANAFVGARLEFFDHFYLQGNAGGGFSRQSRVRTRLGDATDFARQTYAYYMLDFSVGIILFLRPTNDCQSCPVW